MSLDDLAYEEDTNTTPWSSYQLGLFNRVENFDDNIVVRAVPGSGKTTSMVEAIKRDPYPDKVALAFNRDIADDFSAKLGAHAEGEIGKVITGGVLPPPGDTVFDQQQWLINNNDDFSRFIILIWQLYAGFANLNKDFVTTAFTITE